MVCHSTHSDNCLYRGVVPEMVRRKTLTLTKLKTKKKRIKDKFLNFSGRNTRLQIGKVLVGEGLDINFLRSPFPQRLKGCSQSSQRKL